MPSRKAISPASLSPSKATGAFCKPKVFLLADYGYPGYANMVLVPQKWIDTNRKAVQGFVDATRDGWLNYLNDPRPGNALIKQRQPRHDGRDPETVVGQDEKLRHDPVRRRAGLRPGQHDGAAVEAVSLTSMTSEGLYPKGLDFRRVYDLSFVRATLQKYQ